MTDAELLAQTAEARRHAEALLKSLLEARASSEKNLSELGQADAFKKVTGRSSLDNAVASAQRLIDALDRAASELKRDPRP